MDSMKSFFKKIWFYRDLSFLLYLLKTSYVILRICANDQEERLFEFIQIETAGKAQDKEKAVRYAQVCFQLWRIFKVYDRCLTRSVILCHALRKLGFDAKVNFGTEKDRFLKIGHCWVEGLDAQANSRYNLIFQYPR